MAPSPSSGASASAAAAAPAASSARCRCRSRSARSSSSSPGSRPVGVLDERAQLREPGLGERGVRGQLVVPAAGGVELTPGGPRRRSAGELLLAAERGRAPRAGTTASQGGAARTGPTSRRRARQRRRRPPAPRRAPRIGARATVGEHAARDHERVLVLGPQLRRARRAPPGDRAPPRCRPPPGGADVRVVALRAEQQAERLGEDRLARARLPRDRVQPGREVELGLVDEDEVLDAEPPEHAAIVDPRADAAHSL